MKVTYIQGAGSRALIFKPESNMDMFKLGRLVERVKGAVVREDEIEVDPDELINACLKPK